MLNENKITGRKSERTANIGSQFLALYTRSHACTMDARECNFQFIILNFYLVYILLSQNFDYYNFQ